MILTTNKMKVNNTLGLSKYPEGFIGLIDNFFNGVNEIEKERQVSNILTFIETSDTPSIAIEKVCNVLGRNKDDFSRGFLSAVCS